MACYGLDENIQLEISAASLKGKFFLHMGEMFVIFL
jgi:hypothetical protein